LAQPAQRTWDIFGHFVVQHSEAPLFNHDETGEVFVSWFLVFMVVIVPVQSVQYINQITISSREMAKSLKGESQEIKGDKKKPACTIPCPSKWDWETD
jgi:hypothetical protein